MKRKLDIQVLFTVSNRRIDAIDLTPASSLSWSAPGADSTLSKQIEIWFEAYCRKASPQVVLPLNFSGLTPFTKAVLDQLMDIPFGSTLSYLQLAEKLGKPKSARAVGQACGRNPFPLVIPCHRVITSQGSLGGFSCGLSLKELLLQFEKRE